MARAIRISEYGGPEVMHLVEFEPPVPGPGEVLLEIRAAGVNPIDWKIRAGLRSGGPITEPIGLGSDGAGVVSAVGAGVTTPAVGDEVIARSLRGSYATHVITTPDKLTPKPANLDWPAAASFGIPVSTAYQALKSLGVNPGDTVLVHAGAGGVGQAAVQLARHWGATVIATASEPNHARLVELGAIPVTYGEGLVDRVRAVAPQGVNVALDAAGTEEAIDASLELVADRSRIGTIVLYQKRDEHGIQGWTGAMPGYLSDDDRRVRAESIGYTADLAARGEFDVEIAAVYPLERAGDAHALSETGHVRGNIVLIP